jgi:cytoskeletal protein CcmA (bactofilin family)
VFGKKEIVTNEKIETIIGKDTVINGSVKGNGIIRVDGRIQGEEVSHGEVIIGDSGEVAADIKARQVTIAGLVKGNIYAEGKVEIVETGKVLGNIRSVNLIINEGALFQGTCDMKFHEEAAVNKVEE